MYLKAEDKEVAKKTKRKKKTLNVLLQENAKSSLCKDFFVELTGFMRFGNCEKKNYLMLNFCCDLSFEPILCM